MNMKIYLAVSNDELQLPIAIADSARELAYICHTTENNIRSCISKAKKYGYHSKFIVVEAEDD